MAKVSGLPQLRSNLRKMSDSVTGAQLDSICRQSLAPLREAVDASAPRSSLKGTSAIIKKDGRGKGTRVFWLGFKGAGLLIAHLVELGTAPHSLAKGASRRNNFLQDVPPFHPGSSPEPFVRPSFEATKSEVIATYGRLAFALMVGAVSKR